MKSIILTNTLTRKKEKIVPREGNNISLYVCGVTPYDFSHIGHGRSYVNFDVLVRLLRFVGYKVTYVRNVTDIDDKLLNRAEREYGSSLAYDRIARIFTQAFQRDVGMLNCITPDVEPLVTTHIPQIITFIEKLVATGYAYQVDSDVYFDVTSAPDYGSLSGKKLDELKAGARVHINEKKKQEADFVLWKGNDQNLFWPSPWGYGRPGWHIECSVLAYTYLGATVDIHGGGADLIFPHHENEMAQSQSYSHQPFVRCWMHNALLNLDKEKMSKSLGNTLALHDVFAQVDPMVVRFYLLQHTYKTPIEFSIEQVKTNVGAYKRLIQALGDGTLYDANPSIPQGERQLGPMHTDSILRAAHADGSTSSPCSPSTTNCVEPVHPEPSRRIEAYDGSPKDSIAAELLDALVDDLNTPRALGIIFERLDEIKKNTSKKAAVRTFVQEVLGLTLVPLTETPVEITQEIERLIKEREEARAKKDWARADTLRDELQGLGYTVHDKKI